jgi:hypothetical protein
MTKALRSKLPISVLLAAAWFALLGATHCGGEAQSAGVANAGAGMSGSSGSGSGAAGSGAAGSGAAGSPSACHSPLSTPVGRPHAVACPATAVVPPVASTACSADSDCAGAAEAGMGGADAGFSRCLLGKCSLDECLTDSDCPSGNACRCSDQLRGNVVSDNNTCMPAECRVDADCGPGGACSPDTSGRCGSLVGYQCHSAADSCHSDADCCGDTAQCSYQPELGHWACAAFTVCNG